MEEFATRLRAAGIDAWLDQWEIRAGDSLVKKVFLEGIDEAEVFIVVLSDVSVAKPWVVDELDAAVVRRIQQGTRLIPVLLDEVPVPAPLTHIRWVSVPALGIDGAVNDIVSTVFEQDVRPPLGPAPDYTSVSLQMLDDPADDIVLGLIVDLSLERGIIDVDEAELVEKAQALGLVPAQVEEALHALKSRWFLRLENTLASSSVADVNEEIWLRAMRVRGMNIDDFRNRILVDLANSSEIGAATATAIGPITLEKLLKTLEDEDLVALTRTYGGVDAELTPLGRRAARNL